MSALRSYPVFHGPLSANRFSYRDSGGQNAFPKTKALRILRIRGGEGIVQRQVFVAVGEECSGETLHRVCVGKQGELLARSISPGASPPPQHETN